MKNIKSCSLSETRERHATPTNLVGRTGVALVEFQLGRRGFEYVNTLGNSSEGDIWAQTAEGKISIEVKASATLRAWRVKELQRKSDFYCLVSLVDAECFVLSRQEIVDVIASCKICHPGVHVIPVNALPNDSYEGWHRLGGEKMRAVTKAAKRTFYRSTRKIVKTLADGTVKTYTYEPTKR